ncbi:hypothetical protein IFM89_030793 [Coptis chinensis]|uniref:Hydrophobic seed protein domain-containing protein n=1 Tax=Coptis chinensis TaxID=261450 RepID=A0A835IGL1_9MAGN|nr:hypothetical protein IFM89_030793 [Coptis chinensis]
MIFSQPNCPIDSILFILHHDPSNSDEGSVTFVDIAEYRVDDNDVEFFSSRMPPKGSSGHGRYGSENVNDNILVKAVSVYGDARIHIEKEQEDLNRLLSSQVLHSPRHISQSYPTCPINALKLGACVDVLGGLIHIGLGDPVENVCCLVLGGLLELEAAVYLCTTLRLKLLNLNIFIPLALQALITCGKTPPPGFICPPLT